MNARLVDFGLFLCIQHKKFLLFYKQGGGGGVEATASM